MNPAVLLSIVGNPALIESIINLIQSGYLFFADGMGKGMTPEEIRYRIHLDVEAAKQAGESLNASLDQADKNESNTH